MVRQKVRLAYITNNSARKISFNKRLKSILNKMKEITILCAIEACAIIYSPYSTKPILWPNKAGAESLVSKFRQLPKAQQTRRMLSHQEFLQQSIKKVDEQVKKQRNSNRKMEVSHLMYECLNGAGSLQSLSVTDLTDLGCWIDENLNKINARIESLVRENGYCPLRVEGLLPPLLTPQTILPTSWYGLDASSHVREQGALGVEFDHGFGMNPSMPMQQPWIMDITMNESLYQREFGGNTMLISMGDDCYNINNKPP